MTAPKDVTRVSLACILLALAGAACSPMRASPEDTDMRYRAATVLRNGEKVLSIFPRGSESRIDETQAAKIRQFAGTFRQEGRGPMLVAVPQEPDGRTRRPEALLAVLAGSGVSGRAVRIVGFVPYRNFASAWRLSYGTIEATAICDERPSGRFERDPGAARLGCAYTAALARTVADPLDLAEPRAVGLYRFTKATAEPLASTAPAPTSGQGPR